MRNLSRTARGTSAPPNISLTSASILLGHITASTSTTPQFQRQTRRGRHARQTTPQPSSLEVERLGSPFAFHTKSRPGTPSTVASLTDSLHAPHALGGRGGAGNRAGYWLRSSRESELEWRIGQLRSPMDLRVLMEQVRGDPVCLARCHGILLESLIIYAAVGEVQMRDALRAMDLGQLVQHADALGFWNAAVLPGLQQGQHGTTNPHNLVWAFELMGQG